LEVGGAAAPAPWGASWRRTGCSATRTAPGTIPATTREPARLALVEGELARREAELEALLGQQRVLRDQVDLATLTVHMSEDAAPSPSDDGPGFVDGLRRGWVAAVDGGRVALAVAGFVLPFAVPLALVALGVRRWQRRRPVTAPAD
jgi:hypothetical protein